MKFPWQAYETTETCRWCGGTGMHTRNDLADHPDDVGRMYRCRMCDEGKVKSGMTLAQYAAKAREAYTGDVAFGEKFLRELEQREAAA